MSKSDENNSDQGGEATRKRPLSPHLQVYKPQITSMSSIFHRMSGVALVIGSPLLVLWILSIAGGSADYMAFTEFTLHPIVYTMLIGWSWAFWYHLLATIRHLAFDAGYGFDLDTAKVTGVLTFTFSFVFTALTWVYLWLGVY